MTSDAMTFTCCGTCGIRFALPTALYEAHRKEGGFHHCPNGHERGWTKEGSENEKIRRERDSLKQHLAQKDDEIAAERLEREKVEKREARLKKRISAGVCPCCTRTFTNLARHMATKHPDTKPKLVSEKVA